MNFKIAFVGAALAVFGGIFAVGCGGDDCTAAADKYSAKLTDCGKTAPVASTTSGSTTCDPKVGANALCSATCMSNSTCDCVPGAGDLTKCAAADATKLADCIKACPAAM